MAEASIPVNLRNPGQVFACLGLMEAADILCRGAEGGFDPAHDATRTRFTLAAAGDRNPVEAVVRFLVGARVKTIVPADAGLDTDKWGLDIWQVGELPDRSGYDKSTYPCPMPKSPDICPVLLIGDKNNGIPVSHWADASDRDALKFWAGSGGMPGATIMERTLNLIRDLDGDALAEAVRDPFAVARPQSSSFRFDWRRDYTALDVGFSPNAHDGVRMVGYPVVELLAAIGLQHARPERPDPRDKLVYRYGAWSARQPVLLARAALGGAGMGFPVRRFIMRLGWPGQEGQARCIIDAQEESESWPRP